MRWMLAVILVSVLGCGDDTTSPIGGDTGVQDTGADGNVQDGSVQDAPGDAPPTMSNIRSIGPMERPAKLILPNAHDETTPLPLLFLLHGYGANGTLQEALWNFQSQTLQRSVYLVIPEGTTDVGGSQFWNATPECCDRFGSGVDDESYLIALLDDAIANYPIDETQVYFTGHSNGGFMSYRMACAHPDRITAIMSLAGLSYVNAMDCAATEPISVLQVHGTADDLVPYGLTDDVLARWVTRASCTGTDAVDIDMIDLDSGIAGDETFRQRWGSDCAAGIDLQLWTIGGGGHIPALTPAFAEETIDWLLNQQKP